MKLRVLKNVKKTDGNPEEDYKIALQLEREVYKVLNKAAVIFRSLKGKVDGAESHTKACVQAKVALEDVNNW